MPRKPDGLGPWLRDHSDVIVHERRLPDDVVRRLVEARSFRAWVPTRFGGDECGALEGLERLSELASHDAAAGWCVMIANTSALTSYFLPVDHARTIFGRPDAVVSGVAAPMGRAEALAGGGLVVNGRWAWGSGAAHATAIGGGCLVAGSDGSPRPRADGLVAPFVLFEPDQVELFDNWNPIGLAGSGSGDMAVARALVPEGRWVELGRTDPVTDGPLARFPFFGLLAAGVAAVVVGIARRSLEESVTLAGGSPGTGRRPRDHSGVRVEVSRAEATIAGAAGSLWHSVAALESAVAAGRPPSVAERHGLRLAACDTVERCVAAVSDLFRLGGGAVIGADHGLARALADVHVAASHAMVSRRLHDALARHTLGMDPDTSLW